MIRGRVRGSCWRINVLMGVSTSAHTALRTCRYDAFTWSNLDSVRSWPRHNCNTWPSSVRYARCDAIKHSTRCSVAGGSVADVSADGGSVADRPIAYRRVGICSARGLHLERDRRNPFRIASYWHWENHYNQIRAEIAVKDAHQLSVAWHATHKYTHTCILKCCLHAKTHRILARSNPAEHSIA